MTDLLEVALLGELRIVLGGRALHDDLGAKEAALLSYLADTGERHTRQALAGLLWSESTEERARNSLRVALSTLRKTFPDHLDITRQTVTFRRDAPHRLDVQQLAAVLRNVGVPAATTADDVAILRRLLAIYRGDFLEGLTTGEASFDEWAADRRAAWQQQVRRALETLSGRLLEEHAYEAAVEALIHWLGIAPWQETAHRRLMLVYGRLGRYDVALRQYEQCRLALAEELGVEPAPETQTLYQRLLAAQRAQRPSLPEQQTPLIGREEELARIGRMLADPACRLLTITGMGGMGKTRLALAAARCAADQQALQFVNGVAFISLATTETAEALPLTLATSLNIPLSGRGDPAGDVVDYLQPQEMLLVLDNFEQFLPAAAPGPPAGPARGVALVTRLLEKCPHVKLLVTSREPLQLAAEWRLDLEGLATPPTAAERDPAAVQEYGAVQLFTALAQEVGPRFQATSENAPLLARLSRLVGGMPLALKLAAGLLNVRPLEEIVSEAAQNVDALATNQDALATSQDALATEPEGLPERQRSTRAVFDYAWQQLDPEEQRVFAALSVFRGGFTARAAAQVASATPFVLAALVDRGLAQLPAGAATGGPTRYEFHEVTRLYAAQRLAARPAAARRVRHAHCHYYARLMEQEGKGLRRGGSAAAALAEMDNVRAGWRYALAECDVDALNAYHEGLVTFYWLQGWFGEARDTFRAAAAALDQVPQPPNELRALHVRLLVSYSTHAQFSGRASEAAAALAEAEAALLEAEATVEDAALTALVLDRRARLANEQGDVAGARRAGQRALAIYQEMGDDLNAARMLGHLGAVNFSLQDYERARRDLEASIESSRAASRLPEILVPLSKLAQVLIHTGDFAEAGRRLQELAELSERLDTPLHTSALNSLGQVAEAAGDYDAARSHYQESLLYCERIKNAARRATAVAHLGNVARLCGELEEAEDLLAAALAVHREHGWTREAGHDLYLLGRVAAVAGDAAVAGARYEESLALARETGDREGMALAHTELGRLALAAVEAAAHDTAAQGTAAPESAAQHLLEALRLAHSLGARPALLKALVSWAALQLAHGKGRIAARLLALAAVHPAAPQEVRQEAEAALAEQRKQQAQEVERARRETQQMPLEEMVQVVLEGAAAAA